MSVKSPTWNHEAAITAAETATWSSAPCHTIGAATTVESYIDAFPANQQNQIRSVLRWP